MSYDPNEARDQAGKWTSSGDAGGEQPGSDDDKVANAKYFRGAVDEVATKLKYDPALISVTDQPRQFTVNGTVYNEGGHTVLADKTISLFQGPFWTKSAVQGVTAHEIMHAKFQTFLDDYQAEYKKMTDATSHLDVDQFMKPNGLLKGEWADKFPLYQTYTTVMMPSITDDFAKSDGITKYSQDYWDEWKASKIGTAIAMHETLAEMARLHFEQGKIVAPPGITKSGFLTSKFASKSWSDLYKAISNHWDETHK
jgi:hypothetical protein